MDTKTSTRTLYIDTHMHTETGVGLTSCAAFGYCNSADILHVSYTSYLCRPVYDSSSGGSANKSTTCGGMRK
jgi:hypothetical protein